MGISHEHIPACQGLYDSSKEAFLGWLFFLSCQPRSDFDLFPADPEFEISWWTPSFLGPGYWRTFNFCRLADFVLIWLLPHVSFSSVGLSATSTETVKPCVLFLCISWCTSLFYEYLYLICSSCHKSIGLSVAFQFSQSHHPFVFLMVILSGLCCNPLVIIPVLLLAITASLSLAMNVVIRTYSTYHE